jgi:hypothetical protein
MSTDLPPRLKDLLGGVGARLGLEDARATGLIWKRWDEIVGPGVAANAEPTSLRRGLLKVRATSPAWAQELTFLAAEIVARANAIAGAETVREVRVWTGPGEVVRATSTDGPGLQDGSEREVAKDLPEAFERARRAWAKRRSERP